MRRRAGAGNASPAVRCRLVSFAVRADPYYLIPPPTMARRSDYPRCSGELVALGHCTKTIIRSPPLVRGMDLSVQIVVSNPPLTPARAGKHPGAATWSRGLCAYPRCGGEWVNVGHDALQVVRLPPRERGMVHARALWHMGIDRLPPRERGMATETTRSVSRHPLTPARAGNGTNSNRSECCSAAYPRARGEWCEL